MSLTWKETGEERVHRYTRYSVHVAERGNIAFTLLVRDNKRGHKVLFARFPGATDDVFIREFTGLDIAKTHAEEWSLADYIQSEIEWRTRHLDGLRTRVELAEESLAEARAWEAANNE